jgi:hypothetical protein
MRDLIKNKFFSKGFLIGLLLFAALNFLLPIYPYDNNYLYNVGFPFSFYRSGYISHTEHIREILWLGLIGDLLLALLISALTGLGLRFLADRKLKLK